METSPQDQETEAPSAISGTEIDFRRHVGTSQNFEEGNGASSGTGALTVSAHDTSIGAKYKLRSPAELPVSRSPCNLTVSHGLSPTSFLESPILLSNIKAEPSPTTGTFSLSELMQGSSEATAVSLARNGSTISALDQAKSNSFEFQFDTGDTAATGPPVSMANMISKASEIDIKIDVEADVGHQASKYSPDASPRSHMAVPDSQHTPSSHVSTKPRNKSSGKSGPNHKIKSFSSGKDDRSDTYHDSGVRSSSEQLPKNHKTGKRRDALGYSRTDDGDHEPRDSSSSNSLPSYMRATQSARAKAVANSSPRSSPDVLDKGVYLNKRHSLPGSNTKHGAPRVQPSASPTSQSAKSNGVQSPQGQLSLEITKSLSSMGSEDKDMTLKLVDHLLLRIISFLPTKDAVRMSVLSRRWRYLWTSFSNIDLNDSIPCADRPPDYPRCRTSFLHFVYRLLLGHDDSDITRFKVSCDVHVDAVCVHSWISAVVKHNVKELHLRFPLTESCILPSSLFSNQSLTILSINFMNFHGLGFPSSPLGGCPCLKSLNLSNVTLSNNYSTKKLFSELSSIFPVLQQLSLVRCEWEMINNMVISSSTLVNITIEFDGRDLLDCQVLVVAPNLSFFYCTTDSSIDIALAYPNIFADTSLNFAISLDIGIATEEELVVVYQRLERLLFEMRNSKRLTMSVETFEASRGFFERVPVFQNLTCLNIVGDFWGNPAQGILEFMQKMPNLEHLSTTFMFVEEYDDENQEMGPVPSCLMDKLKKVKVSGLRTATAEMDLIKFFLENACNLEEVLLCADKWNAETLETFKNELVKLRRSSEKCAFVSEIVPIDTVLSPRLYLERCIPEC